MVRYRYFVSRPCLHGETKTTKIGSVTRVPAAVKSLNEHLRSRSETPASAMADHSAIAELVDRIDVHKDRLDDAGHRMAPTHATKAGIRYRYYVSRPCLHGETKTTKVGSVTRVPAADIEDVVVKSLDEHLIPTLHQSELMM